MREIKFRAWGCQRRPQDEFKMFYQKDFNIEKFLRTIRNKCLGWELLQFTGIKDKKGKDVYEGDIIYDPFDGRVSYIVFEKGEFKSSSKVTYVEKVKGKFKVVGNEIGYYPSDFLESVKDFYWIIGNIYENPELIK